MISRRSPENNQSNNTEAQKEKENSVADILAFASDIVKNGKDKKIINNKKKK